MLSLPQLFLDYLVTPCYAMGSLSWYALLSRVYMYCENVLYVMHTKL